MASNILTVFIKSVADLAAFVKAEAAHKRLQAQADKTRTATAAAVGKPVTAGSADKTLDELRKKFADLRQGVDSLGKTTGNTSRSVAAGSGSLRGMGSAAWTLVGGVTGLAVLLAGAAASALMSYRERVEAARQKIKEFNEMLAENKRRAESVRMESVAGQYDVLRKAIDDAYAAQLRLNAARDVSQSSDKAVRIMELNLQEARERIRLKPGDQVAEAEHNAKFAGLRRSLDTEFDSRAAANEYADTASAVDAAERKLKTYETDVTKLGAAMEEASARIRSLNESIADLYGKNAPTKEEYDTVMGPGGVPVVSNRRIVVDREKQRQLADSLRADLAAAEAGITKKDDKGKIVGGLSVDMAAAREAAEKQRTEVKALRVEADAAKRRRDAFATTAPATDAAESAAEQAGIGDLRAKRDAEQIESRLEDAIARAEEVFTELQRQSQDFDPKTYKKGRAYGAAKRHDARLTAAAVGFRRKIEDLRRLKGRSGAPGYAESVTSAIDAIDSSIEGLASRDVTPAPAASAAAPEQTGGGKSQPSWALPSWGKQVASEAKQAAATLDASTEILSAAFSEINAAIERQNIAIKDAASRSRRQGG